MITIVAIILSTVSAETPIQDNTKTQYCTSDTKHTKGEPQPSEKKSCTQGTVKVNTHKPGLAERKSK